MKWHAFLLEDDLELQAQVQRLLEAHNCEVKTFIVGRVLLDYLRRHRPRVDLAVCDLILPGIVDGTQCIRQLHSRNSDAPMIVITRAAHGDLADLAKLAGATCVLAKPIDLLMLEAAIHRAVLKCEMNVAARSNAPKPCKPICS